MRAADLGAHCEGEPPAFFGPVEFEWHTPGAGGMTTGSERVIWRYLASSLGLLDAIVAVVATNPRAIRQYERS